MRRTALDSLSRAPMLLLITLAYTAYAALRFVAEIDMSLVGLRDLAPYAYGLLALLAFLLPVRREDSWRTPIYAVLTAHLVWTMALPRLPGFPWSMPTLGSDAVLLVSRPDFDTAVMGIAAAYGLHDLLTRRRRHRLFDVILVLFVALNAIGATTLSTRAGLMSGILAVAAVVHAWLRPRVVDHSGPRGFGAPGPAAKTTAVAIVGALVGLGLILAVTPTGSRVVEGFRDGSAQSYGTIEVRKVVWDDVTAFVVRSPKRTAIGVGFGRNFIEESGSRNALEGSTYTNVRSPHNYVVGTLARLGVAGALLAALIILLGWWLALRLLRGQPGSVTVLAALVALTLPVTAMLGVVLESPFGALPYFWAVGHLSATWVNRQADADNHSDNVVEVPPVSAGQAVSQ